MDDYNGNFGKPALTAVEIAQLGPDDPGFDERMMLFDDYFVSHDDTLTLAAPYNCSSYLWVITDPEAEDADAPVPVQTYGNFTDYQREYVLYIPESGLETGKTYKLTLTVKNKGGKIFHDDCCLVIYREYYF